MGAFFTELMGSARYTFDGQQLTQSGVLAKLYDADCEGCATAPPPR